MQPTYFERNSQIAPGAIKSCILNGSVKLLYFGNPPTRNKGKVSTNGVRSKSMPSVYCSPASFH